MGIIYKIKDSVDLYLEDNKVLTVYYMNSRQKKVFRISPSMIKLIEQIDGEHTIEEIYQNFSDNAKITKVEIEQFIQILEKYKIVTKKENMDELITKSDQIRFDRQINYFQEFFTSEIGGVIAQQKVFNSKVLILGCGAIGGDIAILLAMAGVRNFVLYDNDRVASADIARHMYFQEENVGKYKTEALGDYLTQIDSKIKYDVKNEYMEPSTEISNLISEMDFVINTLDEPYIGYTASKISRICIKYNKPHFIAGGFDAHLASTGELIIPYRTPCVECYAKYFKNSLKNWKPKKHPVAIRYMEIGGLASMSLFSSSFATIEIIKYLAGLIDLEKSYKVRGEFLFGSMDLTYLNVEKDPDCVICGGKL